MSADRPNSMRKLDNALRRMTPGNRAYVNIRSLVANAIVCQLMPGGVVKGGTSLKLRFGDAATRYTTDLDTARAASAEDFMSSLAASLAEGWNGFTGRVVEEEQPHPRGVPAEYVMAPFSVKLSYLGKSWCTVMLEVGHDEIGDADEFDLIEPAEANGYLGRLGFPPLDPVSCMPLHHQIAQKLHAASAPGSDRAHDLVDLQVIVANGEVDWPRTKETCLRLFAYRRAQQWPPSIETGEGWSELYDAQAQGLDVAASAAEAVAWANELIKRIDESA